jgi:hypothetical protein
MDGYRLSFLLMVTGRNAVQKAQRVGETLFARMRRVFPALGWADFRETSIEILGSEGQFGSHSRGMDSREVVLKMSAHHDQKEALGFFAREVPSSALSMAQSLIGGGTGLPRPTPLIRVHSMLVPREFVTVLVDGEAFFEEKLRVASYESTIVNRQSSIVNQQTVEVSLLDIAYGRSGDKGNICNVGIVARKPEFVGVLERELTAVRVKEYLVHLVDGDVERFALPGLNAFNFVLHDALGGGGTASLRFDPMGKGMAQILLEMPIQVPADLL